MPVYFRKYSVCPMSKKSDVSHSGLPELICNLAALVVSCTRCAKQSFKSAKK
jgi:hypothetical protein